MFSVPLCADEGSMYSVGNAKIAGSKSNFTF